MKGYIEAHPDEKNAIVEMSKNMQKVINWKKEEDRKKKARKKELGKDK